MERKNNGYWTYERCREEALKYISSSELQRKCSSVYNKIYINSWNELTQHFIKIGNRYKRLVYVYEFSDNFFYVGITGNINRRKKQHTNDINSSVFKHSNTTKSNPKLLVNPISGKSFGYLLKKTVEKESKLKELGYNLVSIWESEYSF